MPFFPGHRGDGEDAQATKWNRCTEPGAQVGWTWSRPGLRAGVGTAQHLSFTDKSPSPSRLGPGRMAKVGVHKVALRGACQLDLRSGGGLATQRRHAHTGCWGHAPIPWYPANSDDAPSTTLVCWYHHGMCTSHRSQPYHRNDQAFCMHPCGGGGAASLLLATVATAYMHGPTGNKL